MSSPGSKAFVKDRYLPAPLRCAILRRTEGAQNASGEPAVTWPVVQRAYVQRKPALGVPRAAAGQELGLAVVDIVAPAGTDVRAGDRLEFDGETGHYHVRLVTVDEPPFREVRVVAVKE